MQAESANNSRNRVRRTSSVGPLVTALVAGFLIVPTSSKAPDIAPPAPIVERVPVNPGPGYYWDPGDWVWKGDRYVWRHGKYALLPRPSAVWVPGHWGHYRDWHWVPGRWRGAP